MKTVFLIIQREYWVRVRKKSFLIMTFLGPILMASLYVIPIFLMTREGDKRTIALIDESNLFGTNLKKQKTIEFVPVQISLAEAKKMVRKEKYYAVLYIPADIMNTAADKEVELFTKKGVSWELENNVRNAIENKIQEIRLEQANIDSKILKQIESYRVAVSTSNLEEENEQESNSIATSVVGYASAFFIYISIFLYGIQVMRGVLEEKTSRIVEVMISTVKPFQLMMGKIVGIGLVGLTQFLLWITLGTAIITGVSAMMGVEPPAQTSPMQSMQQLPGNSQTAVDGTKPHKDTKSEKIIKGLSTINYVKVFSFLIFYFLFGYLMYSALFASVGAAADADTDTQQFMLPVTIPLIFSIVIATYVVQNPDSTLAFWTSIIPLTSPIIMLIRLPFNPPAWEIALSMTLLVVGFLCTTWLAARIYRVGILMYGKKASYKEISKWIFYKG